MPAHTNSTSLTQRMFRPIGDDMRFVRARSHKTPLSHDERSCPIGTSLVPARTKPFSNTTRAGAPEGLCSRPLAQTRHPHLRSLCFCAEQSEMGFVRAGTSEVNFGCLRSSCINRGLCSQARSAQVPERDFARARSHKTVLQHRTRRRPRGTLLVQARANSTSPMTPKTGMAPHTILCEPARTNPLSDAKSAGARGGLCASGLERSRPRAPALAVSERGFV